jgi:hypothetical protein
MKHRAATAQQRRSQTPKAAPKIPDHSRPVPINTLAVYDRQSCIGHAISRGRAGLEAFDADDQSLGTFATAQALGYDWPVASEEERCRFVSDVGLHQFRAMLSDQQPAFLRRLQIEYRERQPIPMASAILAAAGTGPLDPCYARAARSQARPWSSTGSVDRVVWSQEFPPDGGAARCADRFNHRSSKSGDKPMANEIANIEDDGDDGFSGALTAGRLIKGTLLRWNDNAKWTDRDGMAPPSPMLVVAINEALQKWQGKKPIKTITTKPLPDVDALNESVPSSLWEPGLNGGASRPPWVHQVLVYLVHLRTGEFFTYVNGTVGAHIAFDHLKEAVMTMRALRGQKAMPLVELAERPMKTSFGMRKRPHFEIIDWRTPGGDNAALAAPQPAQLSGPAAAPAPEKAVETLAAMGKVAPVTTEEFIDDAVTF